MNNVSIVLDMSVRMRHTKGHTGNRRSHHALTQINVVRDADGVSVRLPHHLDETTGFYRGRQIVSVKKEAKKETKEKKKLGHEHIHGPITTVAEEKKDGSRNNKNLISKIASATRPRSRSGTGGET